MDPTTLVTFLFKAPPEARTVELLGSWDNFRQPYRMHNDRRRGAGFWSGCFKYHNIIFDGDRSSWTKPRSGGLKQGGTYWYYYRLDDEIEAYDDSRDYTTGCPLLPGQTVNVIEVPMEIEERPCRSRSASVDVVGTLTSLPSTHTLDPGDKFAALDPPPISKVHGRCRSDLALNGRLESTADFVGVSSRSPPATAHSEYAQTQTAAGQTSDRFYAHASYVDDRSSLYSSGSWRSAAPSFAHSSVFDVYGVESPLVDEAGSGFISFPNVPWPGSRSQGDTPIEEQERFDSQFEVESESARNGNEFDRSDFGLPSDDVDHDSASTAEADYDLSGNHAPDLESALPAVDSSHDNADTTEIDDDSPIDYAPNSPCGTSGYGSRPSTSHGARGRRPRSFSLSSSPHSRIAGESGLTFHASSSPPEEPTVVECQGSVSPRQSDGQTSDAENEVENEADNEADNDDAFDILSPTFSAATMSSTGGVNTPYRLSVSHSASGIYATNSTSSTGNSIETVAERLRCLGSIDDDETGLPPPMLGQGEDSVSPRFTGYALPNEEMAESTRSLGSKLSSGGTSEKGTRPTILTSEAQETSFAESIFSELSFLGAAVT